MLVFGLVAELLIGSFQVTRFERQKGEAAEAGQLALNRILCEVREACNIAIPPSKREITLTKFNPARTTDLTLDLNRYHYLLEVRYSLDGNGTLLRDVRDLSGGTTDTYVVADGIQGARFEFIDDDVHQNLKVTFSVNLKNQLRSFSSEVTPMAYLP